MIRQWWTESQKAGAIKTKIYEILQRHYNFSTWHMEPVNNRPYGLEIVRMLNKQIDKNRFHPYMPFVEVGCGLGDIIGSLKWKYEKVGYDISAEVLKGGAFLHPRVRFCKGTFDDIACGDINCLIMVNFIHLIPCDRLKSEIDAVLKKNRVKMFVLDSFKNNEGTEYVYSHNGEYLFGGKYKLVRRSKGFVCAHGAQRYIEYWQLRKEIAGDQRIQKG